jgi:hypothetical protein
MLSSKQIAEIVQSTENKDRIKRERDRYNIYHGKLRDYIRDAIFAEFILKETVSQLTARIIPINVTQKIVNKLAKVYLTPPSRKPVNELNTDQQTIGELEKLLNLNTKMTDANRYFKLSKHFCLEAFPNQMKPQLRVLAAHHYTPISDDGVDPTNPTYIVKHLRWGPEDKQSIHVVWSDLEHYTMNGKGDVFVDPSNPEGLNPYGINPLVYCRSQKDELIPVEDDDLLFCQIAICLLLTDLNFASKFKLWNLVYIIGSEAKNLSFNPNSILNIPAGPAGQQVTVGTIESKLDSDAALRTVQSILGMLLSTKSLKSNSMQALDVNDLASGVSKVLDSAESTEDKTEQQNYFVEAEQELFARLKRQIPVWSEAGLILPKYRTLTLSEDFELTLRFAMPKPLQSEKETVETEKLKLENKFTTRTRALAVVNSDLSSEEVEQLELEIEKETKENELKPSEDDNIEEKTTGQDGKTVEAQT